MTGQELLDLMEFVEPQYIEEADALPIPKAPSWKKWCALAACCCLILGAAYIARDYFYPNTQPAETTKPSIQNIQNLPPSSSALPYYVKLSSLEELVRAQQNGDLDHLLPDWEHFYLLEEEFDGFKLSQIQVTKNRIDFHYIETVDHSSNNYETSPLNSSNREMFEKAPVPERIMFSQFQKDESHSLALIAKQFNTSVGKDGYVRRAGETYFEFEDFVFSIYNANFDKDINIWEYITYDFDKIKNYCNVKKESFADYDLQEYFDQLAVTYADPSASVSISYWEEYALFLSCQDSSFISYEQLKALGAFQRFSRGFYPNGDVLYSYTFKDAQGNELGLSINYRNFITELAGITDLTYISRPSKDDLRTVPTDKVVRVRHNGFNYRYYNKRLQFIEWEQDGVFFALSMSHVNINFWDSQPLDGDTLLGKLLMGIAELPAFPDIPE